MRASSFLAVLLLLSFGCPHDVRSDSPMAPGFEKAMTSFRDYAATQLKVAPKKVQVGPPESLADSWKTSTGVVGKVGRAWAFEGSGPGPGDARGWALPDGTVITLKQNLGRLFEESGAWSDHPGSAEELARRLVWSLGMGNEVARDRPAPLLAMQGAAGTFTFFRELRVSGGGNTRYLFQVTITLTVDHQATAQFSDNLNH